MDVQDRIQAILTHRIMLGDGAIGTLLQTHGLVPGQPPELFLLENPARVEQVHRLYQKAGADFITTNTFGANRRRLAVFGLSDQFHIINHRAVYIAQKATASKTLIAAGIGPTGERLGVNGSMTIPELEAIYLEQTRELKKAGADFAMLETMTTLEELLVAARACRQERFPFMASMAFDKTERALTEIPPKVVAKALAPYNPLALGVNCGDGFTGMARQIEAFFTASSIPVLAQPSAGLPANIGGKMIYPVSPGEFAAESITLVEAGAAIIGGCCGSTPDHVLSLRQAVQNLKPRQWNG